MPDYEIVEWNEDNFDVNQHPWIRRMHEQKQFAFASDWARLKILQQHGGIYLDIDVEVMKSLDPFLAHRMFWGFEYECYLATSIIGSEAGHPLLSRLLAVYDAVDEPVVNNRLVTRAFLKEFDSFLLNGSRQVLPDDVHLFSKEYFSIPTHHPQGGFSRHHATNLWCEKKIQSRLKYHLRRLLGEVLYFKLVAWKIHRTSEFREVYRKHQR